MGEGGIMPGGMSVEALALAKAGVETGVKEAGGHMMSTVVAPPVEFAYSLKKENRRDASGLYKTLMHLHRQALDVVRSLSLPAGFLSKKDDLLSPTRGKGSYVLINQIRPLQHHNKLDTLLINE